MYSNEVNLILENQAGFRKDHGTIDHIFTLHTIIEIFKNLKKKLYCEFIDFEKAFDSVWRIGLWNKLLVNSNINGKCFKIIKNMYNGIKAKLKINGFLSGSFPCQLGVRQGENLSPFLFSVFLNDLESFLTMNNINGLQNISEMIGNELYIYIKLFAMLYADDTILFAETPDELQDVLNCFYEYCQTWRLKVNVKKTKIMIFGRYRTVQNNLYFTYNDTHIEIVDNYKYLGTFFTKSGSFMYNIKEQYDKAVKAMYSVLSKCKQHNLSIDCQVDMFDRIIQPILLYGCEVWGFTKNALIEKLHMKFCKYTLTKVKSLRQACRKLAANLQHTI